MTDLLPLTLRIESLRSRDGVLATTEDVQSLMRAMQQGGAIWLDGARLICELHVEAPDQGDAA